MKHRKEIQLKDRRWIYLTYIHQSETYAGLLNGLPTTEFNQRLIKSALKSASGVEGGDPVLIEPTETPIDLDREYPHNADSLRSDYQGESLGRIPNITCSVGFNCRNTGPDLSMDGTTL
ncbi:MAG: hypothetical protein N2C14_00355, partial [Planctomycetales bacterium]